MKNKFYALLGNGSESEIIDYSVTVSKITNGGLDKIAEFVEEYYNQSPHITRWAAHECGVDWSTSNGTYPKRLSNYLYKNHGIAIKKDDVKTIGDIAKKHFIGAEDYAFRVTRNFDWTPGTFGESNDSCYWNDRALARKLIAEHDGLAIQLFNKKHDGYARAWIAFPREGDKIESKTETQINGLDIAVVFNTYGIEITKLAEVVSLYFDTNNNPVKFSINGESKGLVWVNPGSSFGNGYAIGDNVKKVDIVNVKWIGSTMCDYCNKPIANNLYSSLMGKTIHQDCKKYANIFPCAGCGGMKEFAQITKVHSGESQSIYCNECINKYADSCHNCAMWYVNNEIYMCGKITRYCKRCINHHHICRKHGTLSTLCLRCNTVNKMNLDEAIKEGILSPKEG